MDHVPDMLYGHAYNYYYTCDKTMATAIRLTMCINSACNVLLGILLNNMYSVEHNL